MHRTHTATGGGKGVSLSPRAGRRRQAVGHRLGRTASAPRGVRHRRAKHGDGGPDQSARRISCRPQSGRRRDACRCRKTSPIGCSGSANGLATSRGLTYARRKSDPNDRPVPFLAPASTSVEQVVADADAGRGPDGGRSRDVPRGAHRAVGPDRHDRSRGKTAQPIKSLAPAISLLRSTRCIAIPIASGAATSFTGELHVCHRLCHLIISVQRRTGTAGATRRKPFSNILRRTEQPTSRPMVRVAASILNLAVVEIRSSRKDDNMNFLLVLTDLSAARSLTGHSRCCCSRGCATIAVHAAVRRI